MSKLPPLKRLVLEDFPSEQQAWLPKLIEPLNEFMGAVSGGLDRKLTLADNLVAQFKTLTVTIDGDSGGKDTTGGSGTADALAKWIDDATLGAAAAADVLTIIKTVDGTGSGLDADTVDGSHASSFVQTSAYTAADVLTKIKTVDGSGSGLDADLLDGAQGSAYARLASPAFTGSPTAPTATAGDNSTKLATTAFVAAAISGSTVQSGRATVPTTAVLVNVAVSGLTTSSDVVVTPMDSTGTRGTYRVTVSAGSFSIILDTSGSPAVDFMWIAVL